MKIKIPEQKNNTYMQMQSQQITPVNNINNNFNNNNIYNNNANINNNIYNQNINNNNIYNQNIYNNNANINNIYNNNANINNIYNNNTNINNNIYNNNTYINPNNYAFQSKLSYDYTYVNPLNPYYINNQGNPMNYPNYNNNFNNISCVQNIQNIQNIQNFSKNSSIASVIQCLSYCFKDFELTNFKFCTKNQSLFSYDIVNLIEKANKERQDTFKISIQNFRNKASQNIPEYYFGNEEIEPILAFYGLCSYINKEFREQLNECPNCIFQNFKEKEEIPKANFPNVYEIIVNFKQNYHSPFVNCFYYILLNLIKCPKCNYVLNAEIKDHYGISSYIPLNGLLIDKVSNLLELYMTKQFNSSFIYNCKNCDYKGPGKDEVGFLNNPKYLLFNFEGEKEIKTLDDSIDLTNYSLADSKKNKYNLLSFITKENEKYRAYIKNEKHEWCEYNEENIMEEIPFIIKYKCIPYIAIYEKEI